MAVYRYAGRRVGVSAAEQRADFGAGEDHCREGEVRAYGSAGGSLRGGEISGWVPEGPWIVCTCCCRCRCSIFRFEYWVCGICT